MEVQYVFFSLEVYDIKFWALTWEKCLYLILHHEVCLYFSTLAIWTYLSDTFYYPYVLCISLTEEKLYILVFFLADFQFFQTTGILSASIQMCISLKFCPIHLQLLFYYLFL